MKLKYYLLELLKISNLPKFCPVLATLRRSPVLRVSSSGQLSYDKTLGLTTFRLRALSSYIKKSQRFWHKWQMAVKMFTCEGDFRRWHTKTYLKMKVAIKTTFLYLFILGSDAKKGTYKNAKHFLNLLMFWLWHLTFPCSNGQIRQ